MGYTERSSFHKRIHIVKKRCSKLTAARITDAYIKGLKPMVATNAFQAVSTKQQLCSTAGRKAIALSVQKTQSAQPPVVSRFVPERSRTAPEPVSLRPVARSVASTLQSPRLARAAVSRRQLAYR